MMKLLGRQTAQYAARMQQQQTRRSFCAGVSTAMLNSTVKGVERGSALPSNQYENVPFNGPTANLASAGQQLRASSTSSHSTPNLLPPMSLSGIADEDDDGG